MGLSRYHLCLATPCRGGMATLYPWMVDLHPQWRDLGVDRILGLGYPPLRLLEPLARLRLGLVSGLHLLSRERLLVLGTQLRGLDPLGLLPQLLPPLLLGFRLRFSLWNLRLGRWLPRVLGRLDFLRHALCWPPQRVQVLRVRRRAHPAGHSPAGAPGCHHHRHTWLDP
jgi:hypothetical protein